jgi:hypothetical protein
LLQDRQYELGHLTEQYNAHRTFAELLGVQPGTCRLELTLFIRFARTAPQRCGGSGAQRRKQVPNALSE